MVVRSDRRSLTEVRADATRTAVVDAAWDLCRREGLVGWSLRALAKEVGLAAPTLYAYFDSKHAIYDAMFRQGYEEFLAAFEAVEIDPDAPRATVLQVLESYFDFCTAEPVRHQLLFQRVIPDFEPSDDAYAASVASYEQLRECFAQLGVTDPSALDLWTALSTGLTAQQLSNDPGGSRWRQLLPAAVDMFCHQVGLDGPAATS